MLRHGAVEPCWGVKIEELKKMQKRIKKDYRLALDLYDSGVYDARYLAGLIADDALMTAADLRHWLANACRPLAGVTVPSVAAGSPHGWDLALEWLEAEDEMTALAGWATLAAIVSVRADAELDTAALRKLIERVEAEIHSAPNQVRYQMNGFLIAVGCFVPALTDAAKAAGARTGKVVVDMGDTSCQVPYAPEYIAKVEARGTVGKKRKSAKC